MIGANGYATLRRRLNQALLSSFLRLWCTLVITGLIENNE